MQIVNGFFDSRPKSAMQIALATACFLGFSEDQNEQDKPKRLRYM